jgi:hypothetical protein
MRRILARTRRLLSQAARMRRIPARTRRLLSQAAKRHRWVPGGYPQVGQNHPHHTGGMPRLLGMSLPSASVAPLNVRSPFTRADARAAGLVEGVLRSARFKKVFYDLYVASEVKITAQIRAAAALRATGGLGYVSHWTAAQLWELPVPHHPEIHVSVQSRGARCSRQGLRSHLSHPQATTTVCNGIRLSRPVQTFLDLAAVGLDLVDLVILGDAMVKKRLTTVDQLRTSVQTWPGLGRKAARRAADLVRKGVDSPMETRLRLLLVLAGLPEPTVNLILRADDGSWVLRFDLCYQAYRLIVEYDGRQHSDDPDQWERDIYRREDLERLRYRIVLVIWKGIFRDPLRTLTRVRDALIAAGATNIPRQFNDQWQRHFPADQDHHR